MDNKTRKKLNYGLLDIYDENGILIGTEYRKIVHEKGLWHKTVHCWLYDNYGNIFFQIKKEEKTFYTTASGHVSSGATALGKYSNILKFVI